MLEDGGKLWGGECRELSDNAATYHKKSSGLISRGRLLRERPRELVGVGSTRMILKQSAQQQTRSKSKGSVKHRIRRRGPKTGRDCATYNGSNHPRFSRSQGKEGKGPPASIEEEKLGYGTTRP